MKTFRLWALMSALALLALCWNPTEATAARDQTGTPEVLSGELVPIRNTANRFRLVGHSGTFTAPAGVSVEALDGKPVHVEIGHNGRVLQITQEHIAYEPITHGFQIVRGELLVTEPGARGFRIAGDSRRYIAPPGVDVQRYDGRMVRLEVNDQGRVVDISASGASAGGTMTSSAPPAITCAYDGHAYGDGVTMCQSGMRYRCEDGAWHDLGLACTTLSAAPCEVGGVSFIDGTTHCESGEKFICERGQWRNLGIACAADALSVSQPPRMCIVGGASVADGSSICRNGRTFRCVDGQWLNAWTACR